MLHPNERENEAVPAGLRQHALARVDEDDREVGVRGTGRHVAGVLLVARGVGDDELALVGRKEAVGDIDGDALLPLRGEAIHEQGEIDAFITDRAVPALLAEGSELVVEDELAVIEQSSDQGGLAVVDRAACQETQQALACLLRQPELEIGIGGADGRGGVHQKYPSCFFFSIEPTLSLSMRRPSRSEVREACISMMIEGRSDAVERMPPLSG